MPHSGETSSSIQLLSKASDWSELSESFARRLLSIHAEATNMANSKKVALVTGSNRGIGFETARQLGQQGVTVIVSARAEREAAEAASKLRSEGIEADAMQPIALLRQNSSSRTTASWISWSTTVA
jgi:NAD(P)H-hydrate repair Nnr-like enzyme with NAD(P)H-hydrate epimerase domain